MPGVMSLQRLDQRPVGTHHHVRTWYDACSGFGTMADSRHRVEEENTLLRQETPKVKTRRNAARQRHQGRVRKPVRELYEHPAQEPRRISYFFIIDCKACTPLAERRKTEDEIPITSASAQQKKRPQENSAGGEHRLKHRGEEARHTHNKNPIPSPRRNNEGDLRKIPRKNPQAASIGGNTV